MLLRHMLKDYASSIPPWEWDENYPEDMYGHYYPEDINALVQIDYCVYLREKEERDKK